MTDLQMQAAREKLCALSDSNDKEALLERCASTIWRLETFLALDGLERLEAHRQIGGALLRAKKLDAKNFVPWVTENFGHGREWRCTHTALARRWDDLARAREWAAVKGLKLAACYSVDGAMHLLRAWDAEKKPEKRRLTKEAKRSADGDLSLEQSPEQREIEMLRQQLEQQHAEAAHFRILLPIDVRNRARALAVLVRAHDGEAERELRTIARQHCWLFHDLCEDLAGEESGEPDFAAERSSLETPIVDEESEGEAISETFADAPKPEESSSDEMGAPGGHGNGDASGSGVPQVAARDNPGASPPLADERPQRGQGATQGTLHMRPGFVPPHRTLTPTSQTMDQRKVVVVEKLRRNANRVAATTRHLGALNSDRPSVSADDLGEIPR